MIDWQSKENHIFLNPRLDINIKNKFLNYYKSYCENLNLESKVFLLSSGTESKYKLFCLSKEAILKSAGEVNNLLGAKAQDAWLCPLPIFHIGGLSIYARSYLSSSYVEKMNVWDVNRFCHLMTKFSFSSLVPTQVYDLVKSKIAAPKNIKAVFVGGAYLNKEDYNKAYNLGWPLRPTFGATEYCSQIASALESSPEYPKLKILPHIDAQLGENNLLQIRTESLFDFYINDDGNRVLPELIKGYYQSDDICELENNFLVPRGRNSEFVKILGEGLSILNLEEELSAYTKSRLAIVAIEEPRSGYDLVCTSNEDLSGSLIEWNKSCLAFHRIKYFYQTEIPKNEMLKILRDALKENIRSKRDEWLDLTKYQQMRI